MKVYLGIRNPLDGYLNLFPATDKVPEGFTASSINDFPGVCENEVTQLVIHGVLEKIDPEDVGNAVNYWVSRLAHGAILTITFRDIQETCHQIAVTPPSIESLNYQLFTNRSAHTADSVPAMLTGCGLQIISVLPEGVFCTVIAVRP